MQTATKNMFALTMSQLVAEQSGSHPSTQNMPVYRDKIVMRSRDDRRDVDRVCCFVLQECKFSTEHNFDYKIFNTCASKK